MRRVAPVDVARRHLGHLQIRVEELGEAVVVIDHRGSGTYADNVEFVVADAAPGEHQSARRQPGEVVVCQH